MKIVLTGGPCAGKTSSLSFLTEELTKKNFKVYIVPECATLYFSNGVSFLGMSSEEKILFQSTLMKTQMHLEDSFEQLAKASNEQYVLICDRGLLDGKAFTNKEDWEIILHENNWSESNFLNRYDAVIHLVSAARGAENFYAKTKVRHESLEDAANIDISLISCWTGHDKLRVIDNFSNFEGKLKRVREVVFNMIGLPEKFEIERKFKVSAFDLTNIKTKEFNIEQYYLDADSEEVRIRKKTSVGDNYSVYTYTVKSISFDGKRKELERRISSREFFSLKEKMKSSIIKKRISFIYEDKTFELDKIGEIILLEIEVENLEENINFPDFIKIEKEVTHDSYYYNSALARKI